MSAFQESQRRLANHLRNPQQYPAPPGIEDRRLAVYRELFYRNIESFIANGFPVLRTLTEDSHWHAMVRDFYTRHACHSPYFLDIAEEFLAYLQQERGTVAGDPPFLLELAHYEWMELVLDIAEQEAAPDGLQQPGDLRNETPVLNPILQLLTYQFPVHQIGPDFRPDEAPPIPTFLLVYRNRHERVQFLALNAFAARLIELLAEPLSGLAVLEQLAEESRHPDPAQVIDHGLALLREWQHKDIIWGTLPVPGKDRI